MAEEAGEQAALLVASEEAGAKTLPPLGISGVVVSKAQLIDALRVYVPSIVDFSSLPDGQHFSILFSQDSQVGRS